ncbi:hypothetical protein [Bacillus salipaludis]|uniref:hypothetical protein n=1 Tax=Bacillus salipaludis TaxID=2547811 RepID=UPI002E1C891D|nr:hypothetical protein [Bacillus salipaludis]
MKKIQIFFLSLLIVVGGILGYVKYKLISVENAVNKYLTTEAHVPKKLISTDPFIANLSGSKNWMVLVKIKGDPKAYSYFKNDEGKIVLESYTINNEVKILYKIMN